MNAVRYLQSHARSNSISACAQYTREAIQAGGIYLARTNLAKDYGSSLVNASFYEVQGEPQAGDVVVIQATGMHTSGHMAMFDGQIWISDFKQMRGFYPGHEYRTNRPAYKMYRHD
ncbi:CHAP domain-containing protein [Paraburkholderia metrosideri]|uniref:CHAP domain-containing protein n=1 Tax=Paraburkholderia metrosideri TaxID=580937 RepID=A0ABM8NYF3_9BURK|nr:CHAP domain-containing protein [Paraburkholderia metrosideri]CAD6549255.1 hypothetical protein LMG28140_04734 [Paraburkholderia metrosideri]